MFCDSCKTEKLVSDFINNKNICYKCMYQKKIEKIQGKRTPKVFFCRCCEKEIIHDKELKKRQRTVFCSEECAEKGHRERVGNYWTRKIRSGRVV